MPQGKPLNPKRVRHLIALGQSPSQVAKSLGVTVNAIYRHTEVRARGRKKRGRRRP
ncbi:MAG: hypothetical protein HS116_00060 [Planctomycetes bacterium]|nr:hypothetical protein [Planctomycetota bacterium]